MTDEVTFADYVTSERERLGEERRKINDNIAYFQGLLDVVDRDLAAVDAYEAAKLGKPVAHGGGTANVTRARRGSRREAILQAVRAAPAGMSRGDIIDAFGLRGDKSGEMSISNALTALMKSGQLVREGGKYYEPAGRGETVSALREAAE